MLTLRPTKKICKLANIRDDNLQETYEPIEDTVSLLDGGCGGEEEGAASVGGTVVATAAATDLGTNTGAFTA